MVTEAHLITGVEKKSPFFLPVNGNQIMINVPQGFTKGTYILEFDREENESPVPAGNIEVLSAAPTPAPRPPARLEPGRSDCSNFVPTATPIPPTIMFANLNWGIARMQNATARFIVENGYGYRTDSSPDFTDNSDDVWKSLVNSSINVCLEVWLPNLRLGMGAGAGDRISDSPGKKSWRDLAKRCRGTALPYGIAPRLTRDKCGPMACMT